MKKVSHEKFVDQNLLMLWLSSWSNPNPFTYIFFIFAKYFYQLKEGKFSFSARSRFDRFRLICSNCRNLTIKQKTKKKKLKKDSHAKKLFESFVSGLWPMCAKVKSWGQRLGREKKCFQNSGLVGIEILSFLFAPRFYMTKVERRRISWNVRSINRGDVL